MNAAVQNMSALVHGQFEAIQKWWHFVNKSTIFYLEFIIPVIHIFVIKT